MNDPLGDRMKYYEGRETSRTFLPMLPVYARIDGRSFSQFTRGMNRPWDMRMNRAMTETTQYLVDKTNALVGYTQSDEISLVWLVEDHLSDMFFARKVQKLCSVLSGMTSAFFMTRVMKYFSEEYTEKIPHFDCRVLQLPNKAEATNMILWRYLDAKKNSVSLVCRHYYSAKKMQGKGQPEMLDMIHSATDKTGDRDFYEYPDELRLGTFVRRKWREMQTQADADGKAETYIRSYLDVDPIDDFHRAINREQILFEQQDPLYEHVDVMA